LAPGKQALHFLSERGRIARRKPDFDFQHHQLLEPAPPVAEGDIAGGNDPRRSGKIRRRHRDGYVGPLPSVASGIHEHAPAHRSRHPDHKVQARPTLLGRLPGRERCRQSGTQPPPIAFAPDSVEASAEPNHQGLEPLVR